jgi:hypothetical protein
VGLEIQAQHVGEAKGSRPSPTTLHYPPNYKHVEAESASGHFWRGLQSLSGTSVCYRYAWEQARPDEPGHTFTSRNPMVYGSKPALKRVRRSDYFFLRCTDTLYGPSPEISECALSFDEPVAGVWASGHFDVVADLFAHTSGGPAGQ